MYLSLSTLLGTVLGPGDVQLGGSQPQETGFHYTLPRCEHVQVPHKRACCPSPGPQWSCSVPMFKETAGYSQGQGVCGMNLNGLHTAPHLGPGSYPCLSAQGWTLFLPPTAKWRFQWHPHCPLATVTGNSRWIAPVSPGPHRSGNPGFSPIEGIITGTQHGFFCLYLDLQTTDAPAHMLK